MGGQGASPSGAPDYIVVGAGSAGCVLASRLSEDSGTRVEVLEAGPRDWSIFIHMPAAFAWPLKNDRYNWYYETEPEPWMDERRMYCPRGRVIGGSSSINGMVYQRGHPLDYDGWAADGLEDWNYRHVLPYFRRAETREAGADAWRGGDGPLKVSSPALANPLFRAFIDAGVQAGYPYTPDMNGQQQEGLGPMEMTTWRGRRWSAAMAYLRPAASRPNLSVRRRVLVTRVLFEGERAVGVEYRQDGATHRLHAGREVILCGGAINSPQLLMLSGIGPAEELGQVGIDVRLDAPGVGRNLQDHLELYVQHVCTKPVSLYPLLRPWNQVAAGVQWLLTRGGPCASNQFEAGGYIRSRDEFTHPNLQYHFLPLAISYDGRSAAEEHGFQAHVGPMRPASRGWVKLRSADPGEAPLIRFNYNQEESDRREMREAVRLTREIFAQPAFDPYRGPELAPGASAKSDDEIDAFVRARAESAYHPSCTCRMGTDAGAVVDAEGCVRGVEGLRVVDASIMPRIVSGNLNVPTIMMAEKLADRILGRAPLPAEDVPLSVLTGPAASAAQRSLLR